MNEFQSQIISILQNSGIAMCAGDIARKIKPRSNRIAVTSSLRSMEKRDLVGRIPPRDRWSNAYWFVNKNLPNITCSGLAADAAKPAGMTLETESVKAVGSPASR